MEDESESQEVQKRVESNEQSEGCVEEAEQPPGEVVDASQDAQNAPLPSSEEVGDDDSYDPFAAVYEEIYAGKEVSKRRLADEKGYDKRNEGEWVPPLDYGEDS